MTAAPGMVRRIARALLEHQIETGQCEPDIPWTSFVGEARAAIEAMLQATDEMCQAGSEVQDWLDYPPTERGDGY